MMVERLPQLDAPNRRKDEEREPERIEHEAESSNDHNADVPRAEALQVGQVVQHLRSRNVEQAQ